MAGPPEEVPADELFTKLLERPRPSEVVEFPRKDEDGKTRRIRIRVLHMDEHIEARIRAKKALCDRLGVKPQELPHYLSEDGTMNDTLGDIVATEILAMACVHEKLIHGSTEDNPGYTMVFPNGAEAVRKSLTTDEISWLYSHYLLIKKQFGPDETTIETEEELTAWNKRLVEGAGLVPLAQLDWSQQLELTTSFAARAYFLSGMLASLWSSLPESSKSALQMLGLGPDFVSTQPASTSESGSSQSKGTPLLHQDPDAADSVMREIGVDVLTPEQARAAVQNLFK